MRSPACNNSCKFINALVGCDCRARRMELAILLVLCPAFDVFAQDITPTPQASGESVSTTFEVIVTGSNIPTAEEVGPQPVDTYRNIDIERLGVRSATDFVQKLPIAIGSGINENINTIGDGRNGDCAARSCFQRNPCVARWTSSRA